MEFAEEDRRAILCAGEALADQTKQIVEHLRNAIIARIPILARQSPSEW